MEETPQKVRKDVKRQEAARKGREKYLNKFKERLLDDAKNVWEDTSNTSNDATDTATSTTKSAADDITGCSDTYIYDIGTVLLLAIGIRCLCVFA